MSHKWDWLADRIRECGYPTVTAFANAIAWKPSRLSEMINDISVNGGKIRNFPKNKIGIVSELLHIPPMNLMAYNNDIVSRMVFDDTAQNTTVQINDPKRMLRLADMVNQVLAEENLTWDWEKKYQFVVELYKMGVGHDETNVANDTQQIKTSIKLARLAA